jgi:hypothetical protein
MWHRTGFRAGVGSGIALRVEGALKADDLLCDVSLKPCGLAIDGVFTVGVLTLTRRFSTTGCSKRTGYD